MMFTFIFDWYSRWQASRRRIFFFRAGGRARRVDPVTITNRLNNLEPAWESLLGRLTAKVSFKEGESARLLAERQRQDAVARIVEVGREVFGMPALDDAGNGCTETEVIGTLTHFIGFLWGLAAAASDFTQAGRTDGNSAIGLVTVS